MKNKVEDSIFYEDDDQNDNFIVGEPRNIHSMSILAHSNDQDEPKPTIKLETNRRNRNEDEDDQFEPSENSDEQIDDDEEDDSEDNEEGSLPCRLKNKKIKK